MRFWDGKRQFKYLQVKRDGINIEVIGKTALTRGGQILDLGFLKKELHPGLAELWFPGKPASYVKTAVIDRNEQLILDYYASTELPAIAPLEEVKKYFEKKYHWFIPFKSFVENFVNEKLPYGQEGWILKDCNRGFEMKWKPHWDCDLIVKGFVRGEGKYLNTLGALIVSTSDDRLTTRVSGMTDEVRNYIWENKDELIGKIVEVRHNGILSRGGLRHPRFIRFRDDKKIGDCTYANIKP